MQTERSSNQASSDSKRSRRKYLSTVGSGGTLLLPVGSVVASDDIGTLAKNEPKAEEWMSMGTDHDTSDDKYGEGHLTMEGFRSKGVAAPGGWEIRLDQESNAVAYEGDKSDLLPHLDYSILDVSYSTSGDSEVNAFEEPSTIGGYSGSYEQDDDYTFVEAILQVGYETFIGTISSALGGLVYGVSTLIGEIWAKWNGASTGAGFVNREWLWNRGRQVSNWTRYHAFVEDNDVLDATFGHLIYTWGNKDLFADFTMKIWGGPIAASDIDQMSASKAKEHNIEVYDLEAVEESPEVFGVSHSFLKDYPYDYLYKKPLHVEVVNTPEKRINQFADRHGTEIRRS